MERVRDSGEQPSDGLVTLLKEAADDFGQLIAEHLKLTRVELLADIRAYGQRLAILAALIPFVLLGYALVCLGFSLVLSRWLDLGVALFLVGGVHFVGAVIASFAALRKLHGLMLFHDSAYEANQSVSSLTARITNGKGPTVASPDTTTLGALAIMARAGRGSHIVDSQR